MPRKDPDRHQTRTSFKSPAPRGSGNYPNPTHTQPVNPKTRAPQHTFALARHKRVVEPLYPEVSLIRSRSYPEKQVRGRPTMGRPRLAKQNSGRR